LAGALIPRLCCHRARGSTVEARGREYLMIIA